MIFLILPLTIIIIAVLLIIILKKKFNFSQLTAIIAFAIFGLVMAFGATGGAMLALKQMPNANKETYIISSVEIISPNDVNHSSYIIEINDLNKTKYIIYCKDNFSQANYTIKTISAEKAKIIYGDYTKPQLKVLKTKSKNEIFNWLFPIEEISYVIYLPEE